jgi:hypothetical protein
MMNDIYNETSFDEPDIEDQESEFISRFEKAKKKKMGGHKLEFDMPSRSNRPGSVANNLSSSVFARPG